MEEDELTDLPSHPYRSSELVLSPEEAHARSVVTPDLLASEELLWAGRPVQGIVFKWNDLFTSIFMVFWTGFAIYWTTMAWRAPGPFFAFGLPFIAIGLYRLVGRFFVDAAKRKRTFYGLTNQRALIVVLGRTRTVMQVWLAQAPQIALEEAADGSGTIAFGEAIIVGTGKNQQTIEPASFVRIQNARAVHRLLAEARLVAKP